MSLYHKNGALYVSSITLNVSNLDQMVSFYKDNLGFLVIESTNNQVLLGYHSDKPLLTLRRSNEKSHNHQMYHVAYLVPDRQTLAYLLQRLVQTNYGIEGGADHGISAALYFSDPEGSGMELYFAKDPH